MECKYKVCRYNTTAGCTFEYIEKVRELKRLEGLRSKRSTQVPNFSSPGVLEAMTKTLNRQIRIVRGTRLTRRHLETAITI